MSQGFTLRSSEHDYHFEVKFRLENLRDLFEVAKGEEESVTRTVEIVPGSGWRIDFKAVRNVSQNRADDVSISAHVHRAHTTGMPVTVKLLAETMAGTRLETYTTTCASSRKKLNWPRFLSRSKYWCPDAPKGSKKRRLIDDDVVIITARINAKSSVLKTRSEIRDVFYQRLVKGSIPTMATFAFASRAVDGTLHDVRQHQIDCGVLEASSKRIRELWYFREEPSDLSSLMEYKQHFTSDLLEDLRAGYFDDSDFEEEEEDEDDENEDEDEEAASDPGPTTSNTEIHSAEQQVRCETVEFQAVERMPHETASGVEDPQCPENLTSKSEKMSDDWILSDKCSEAPAIENHATPEDPVAKVPKSEQASEELAGPVGTEITEVANEDEAQTVDSLSTEDASDDADVPDEAIVLTGVAAKTWEAVIFFLYTGFIAFAPLKSEGEDIYWEFVDEYREDNDKRPAPCSCKSIYRVAKILELEDLKALALDHLRSRLTKENIVDEIFSKLTSEHEQIMDLELTVLAEHWKDIKDTPTFEGKVKQVAKEKSSHGGKIILEILKKVGSLTLCVSDPRPA